MGTPEFAAVHLEALIASDYRPVLVVTQPDRPAGRRRNLRAPPVKRLAESHDIPIAQPRRVRRGRLARLLRLFEPDLAIVVAYGRILPPDALAVPKRGAVNIHASLLPAFRGAAPIQRAILEGCRHTGVTLQQMDEGLDTGPLLASSATEIAPDDTSASLHDRLAGLGAKLLVERLPEILAGEITPVPQGEGGVCLAPPLCKDEGQVCWQRRACDVCCQVRAHFPWPGCHTRLHGKRLKILPPVEVLEAPRERAERAQPGTVLAVEPDALVVACGEGTALRIFEVQEENKTRLRVSEFLKGRPIEVGTRLGDDNG